MSLTTGPSANRSDVTDATGSVSFAALTPNPTSGPQAYYDLAASLSGGYQTLAEDVSPNAPAHVQLAPSQTFNTTLRIFKPATINIVTKDAGGAPYTGPVDVTVYSAFRSTTTPFTVTGGSKTITTLGSEVVLPGVNYTVIGKTTTGLCADPAPAYVPDSYPTVLSTTFTLTLTPCPAGTLAVNVQQLSAPAANATVNVTGGPNNMSLSGTTDSAGQRHVQRAVRHDPVHGDGDEGRPERRRHAEPGDHDRRDHELLDHPPEPPDGHGRRHGQLGRIARQ